MPSATPALPRGRAAQGTPAHGAPHTLLPFAGIDDPRLGPASRAFARGDFARARQALAGADAAQDTPAQRALRGALRLDPAIPLTGIALLLLWAVVFFTTV